jgi:hypothetical protein
MTTNETVSLWGCVVCSNIAAQGDRLLDGVFAAIWLLFAGVILWNAQRDRKMAHKDSSGAPDA